MTNREMDLEHALATYYDLRPQYPTATGNEPPYSLHDGSGGREWYCKVNGLVIGGFAKRDRAAEFYRTINQIGGAQS